MALEAPEEDCFDGNFEFDAPQWIDFEGEKEKLESDTNCDTFDWWFQKVHPLHSPDVVNNTPELEPKTKKQPPRRSVARFETAKLSYESGKSSLSGKSSFSDKSTLSGRSNLNGKSSLSYPKRDSESSTTNKGSHTNTDEGSDIKKPRKCWQLNGHNYLGLSPLRLPSLPEDLQPKRGSSNSFSSKNYLMSLPTRASDLVASPLSAISPSKNLNNKNLKTAQRSCPQKLQKSRKAWNESSSISKNSNEDVDVELQRIIEEHNKKILSQQSEYDLNGRRIQKTTSPWKSAKKENMKPVVPSTTRCPQIDDELQELIDNHNRRIWTSQNSEYDLNGRRVRKGHATSVAAPEAKTESKTMLTRSKSLRRSAPHVINNQKRKNTSSSTNSKMNKTISSSNKLQKQPEKNSNDIENEIQEIIRLHNSRLAAKKAKK